MKRLYDSLKTDPGHKGPPDDLSGVDFELTILDRTPPKIFPESGSPSSVLPTLFGETGKTGEKKGPIACTGDFAEIKEIRLFDNSSASISCKIAYGRKHGPSDPEKWEVATETLNIPNGYLASFVIMPNDCLGDMRYSLFAWDDQGNLNPGLPLVVEDKPDECYGFDKAGFDALASDADFPIKVGSFSSNFQEFFSGGKKPLGEGRLVVDDNDYPNLMIQVVSKRDLIKDKYALCFPPPIVFPASRPITIDPDQSSVERLWNGASYTWDELQVPGAKPYVRILGVESANAPNDFFFSQLRKNDPEFVCRNFRLESPEVSDTLQNGFPDFRMDSFGERLGFGSRALVYCIEPLVEDIDYEVSLWSEDNVKWLSGESKGESIPPPYTGIEKADLIVSDRTPQSPLLENVEIPSPTTSFWTKPIRVVFREPVEKLDPSAGETVWDAKHPFIEAKVTDFNKNQRSLKVYFSISEEKSTVRVLEQKYPK